MKEGSYSDYSNREEIAEIVRFKSTAEEGTGDNNWTSFADYVLRMKPEQKAIYYITGGDEKNLAYIQTESWKAAFRSILPPEMLDRCTNFSKAEAMYRKLLEEKKGNGYILEIDHRPHCIAWWDAAREEAMAGYAELICIHSLPENWHCGYGSKMMDAVLADVAKAGYTKILLWVFEQNAPAIAFYRKYGFAASGRKQPAFGAVEEMYVRML